MEEQIILAELQRVVKELQEVVPGKREAGDGLESGGEPRGAGRVQPIPPIILQVLCISSDLPPSCKCLSPWP